MDIPYRARPWTDHDDDTLRQMWTIGLPAAEIGATLGRSKSSVIGRAHRLGIPHPTQPARAERKFGLTPGQFASRARHLPRQIEATRLKLQHLQAEARRYGMNELLGEGAGA